MPPATKVAVCFAGIHFVMPRSANFHPHQNTCHPERSEGSAFHQVRPPSLAKKITPWKLEGRGFIPAKRAASVARALAPEAALNVGNVNCYLLTHPFLAVIQRSAFRDEGSLFDCQRTPAQSAAHSPL
jgi:hypothetical protein